MKLGNASLLVSLTWYIQLINRNALLVNAYLGYSSANNRKQSALFLSGKLHTSRPRSEDAFDASIVTSNTWTQNPPKKLLIHWKGEGIEGYSIQFRQIEFRGALSAVLGRAVHENEIVFNDALNYSGSGEMPEVKLIRFNQAMQYLKGLDFVPREAVIKATERCSLIHAIYEVISEGENYDILTTAALENEGFRDIYAGQENEHHSWCVRVRHYGASSGTEKEQRHGMRTRSMKLERKALQALTPLLLRFGGNADLENPDCKIYIFEGLQEVSALARRIAKGARASVIAPATRICVTNTPLCPIAAFALSNIAQIRSGQAILDPFAGSCATLLAAAMIEPTARTVGIEIAHNGLVNRDDIRADFATRNLTQPIELLHGDCTDDLVRRKANNAIGGDPFDFIITDPPYGIRESTNYNNNDPMSELFDAIWRDRAAGTPLLRKGGRLVCFIPVCEGEELEQRLPNMVRIERAGLQFELAREQPLNDQLSRWLVSYVCVL